MSNEFNVIKDLSSVTSIPISFLGKVSDIIEDIICHDLNESFYDMSDVTEIDIGIGKLSVYHVDDEVKYSFMPSSSFERKIIETFNGQTDPMITRLEESLKNKVMNRYKDLL